MAGCERAEESQHLGPPQLAQQHDLSVRACGVDLKHTLGKVKADGGNLLHGWRLGLGSNDNPIMAQPEAGSRSHPHHQWRTMARPGDRKRQLPLQGKLSCRSRRKEKEGDNTPLDPSMTRNP